MLTSAALSDLATLLAPVDANYREEVPADLADMWIDLGGGD